MKFLVLLALVGAVAAQYQVYTGLHPGYTAGYYPGYAGFHPTGYTAALHPTAYAGFPYGQYYGLPYTFKPAEKAEAEKPAVESRTKRSADEADQKADDALLYTTYAGYPHSTYNFNYARPYYAGYTPASTYHAGYTYPYTYSAYNAYRPLVHHLKKRDTEAAEEDQKADEAFLYTTYAGHPSYYAGYNRAYPYTTYNYPAVYNAAYNRPYTYSGFPYRHFY